MTISDFVTQSGPSFALIYCLKNFNAFISNAGSMTSSGFVAYRIRFVGASSAYKLERCVLDAFQPTKSNKIEIDMTFDKMHQLCTNLKKNIESKVNVYQFTLKFLMRVLPLLQVGIEDFKRFYKLPEMLIEEVDFKSQHPDKIIKCVL